MIQVETCRGCGRPLIRHMVGSMTVRLDAIPLDAQTAAGALMAGRGLWRVTTTSVTPAKPEVLRALVTAEPGSRPHIAQEHACVPVSGPWTYAPAPGSNPPPKAPQGPAGALADLSTPSSVSPSPDSSGQTPVRPAERLPSRPTDPAAGLIVAMLGATVISVDAR